MAIDSIKQKLKGYDEKTRHGDFTAEQIKNIDKLLDILQDNEKHINDIIENATLITNHGDAKDDNMYLISEYIDENNLECEEAFKKTMGKIVDSNNAIDALPEFEVE